jgi:predicted nucleic acid-binding protein
LKSILLDTNAYSAFKRGETETLQIVQNATAIHLSVVVLAELIAGFVAGSKEQANRTELSGFLSSKRVAVLPVDQTTAEQYARIKLDLKRAGKPIPTNDLWIAATAMQHHLCLVTGDAHFRHISGLSTASTLAELNAP